MIITYDGVCITSHDVSGYETAWEICDAVKVLSFYHQQGRVILGGDIFTSQYKYTYDNWFFNMEDTSDTQRNVDFSYIVAREYIEKYIARNGTKYSVIIVTGAL